MLKDNKYLIICLIVVIAIFLITFPSFYASGDEHSYIKTANLLSQGQVIEENILYAAGSSVADEGFIPNVAINFPLFIVPFVFLGVPLIFIFNLLLHLINTALFALIISKLKVSQKYVFLYAFFPALLWLSRTIYPQLFAITLLLAGFFLYIKADELKTNAKRVSFFLSAFTLGFAVFVRPDAVILMILFSLVVLWKKRKESIFFFLGFIIPALLLFSINTIIYGGLTTTAYGHSWISLFIGMFVGLSIFDLIIYLLAFVIFYPLMLFSFLPKFKNKYSLELFSLFLGGIILQASLSKILAFAIDPASFYFINFRYLSLGLPFILIAYAFFLEHHLSKKIGNILKKINLPKLNYKNIFVFGIFILVLLCFAFSFVHQEFVSDRKDIRDQIVLNTPEDALIIGSSDDKIYFIKDIFGERKYISITPGNDIRGFEGDVQSYFNDKTYIMQLTYTNREDSNSHRQVTNINVEREAMKIFIEENNNHLELIFDTETPHNLRIYKWINVK
jgi:hypothetical protein